MKESVSSKGLRRDIWSDARKRTNNDVKMSMDALTRTSSSREMGVFGGGPDIMSDKTNDWRLSEQNDCEEGPSQCMLMCLKRIEHQDNPVKQLSLPTKCARLWRRQRLNRACSTKWWMVLVLAGLLVGPAISRHIACMHPAAWCNLEQRIHSSFPYRVWAQQVPSDAWQELGISAAWIYNGNTA